MPFKNLLLIDDDEDDREIFLSVIDAVSPSTTCAIAANGREGLNALASASTLPQLIFLDLNMPLMDGRQFLVEVKKNSTWKDIPVVVLTTSSDRGSIMRTKALGAADFITKPDKYSGWESTLKKFLTERRP